MQLICQAESVNQQLRLVKGQYWFAVPQELYPCYTQRLAMWGFFLLQDVRQLNEKDSSVRTPKTPKTASNSRSSDLRYW